jgi:hypothetical protein
LAEEKKQEEIMMGTINDNVFSATVFQEDLGWVDTVTGNNK